MDAQQVKNSNSFLQMGRALKSQYDAMKQADKELVDRQNANTNSFEQSLKRRKAAIEDFHRSLTSQAPADFERAVNDLNKQFSQYKKNASEAKRATDDLNESQRTAARILDQVEKARAAEHASLSSQSYTTYTKRVNDNNAAHRALTDTLKGAKGAVRDMTAEEQKLAAEHDRNRVSVSNLRTAFVALREQVDKNNGSVGLFRANLAGLRVGIGGLVAFLAPVIGALVDLAGLLVAVADAAALAAAALGGALIASIAQALPVLGLLVLAFKQLINIIKLTGQQQKDNAANAANAAQKSLQLAQRLEQERQAHIALANAQRQLIQARRDALRNIQDLNAAEQAAYLTSQRATLGLIGSQAALAGLVAGGGSALDVANAQLDVRDARNNVSTARVAQGRASADAARARSQGVAGNPQVIAAQQTIAQQQRQLILDARQYALEQNKVTTATTQYNQALAKLDPAQRKLFDAIVALRKEFTKDWKGITDPIINSFTGIVRGITSALKDPAIQSAFKSLSGATGSAITQSFSFFGTPEAKQLFLQVIHDAIQNLPLIAKIFKDISEIFGRIAVAAGPFVHDILRGIQNFFDDLSTKTQNKNELKDFFNTAESAAKAFASVIKGALGLIINLGTNGGFKTGISLVRNLGTYLQGAAKSVGGTPTYRAGYTQGVQQTPNASTEKFFNNLHTTVHDLGIALDHIVQDLIKVEQTGAFDTLVKVIDQFLLPILGKVAITLGKITNSIGQFALHHKTLTNAIIILSGAVGGLIFAGIGIVKIIGTVEKLQKVYRTLTGTQDAFVAAQKAKAAAAERSAAQIVAADETVVAAEGEVAVGAETAWFAILGPEALIIAAIAAIGVAVYLLDKKFHFLGPTLDWLKKTFFEVVGFIEKNWKGLLIILTGPFGLAVVEIVKHFDAIKEAAVKLKNLLTPIFKFIVNSIIKPVYENGIKPILNGLNDILSFLNNGGLDSAFKTVFNGIIKVAKEALSVIRDIYGVAKSIVTLGGLVGGSNNPNAGKGAKNIGVGKGTGKDYSWMTSKSSGGSGSGAGGIYAPGNNAGYDQGVDFRGAGPIPALGDAIVTRVDMKSSWIGAGGPGTGAIVAYKITSGPQKGKFVYVAENITPSVTVGQQVKKGQSIAVAHGSFPYTEQGFADASGSPIGVLGSSNEGRAFGAAFGLPGVGPNSKPGAGGQLLTGGGRVQPRRIATSRNLLVDISNGIKVTAWDALDQIATGFKNALGTKSTGYKLMVSAITALDQVFTNQARGLTRLVAAQRHRLVSGRYRVSGASGNTSVVDTGNDVTDAQQQLANLGFDRDSILNSVNTTNSTLSQLQGELSRTPNNKKNLAKRQLLIASIKKYQDQRDTLIGQLDDNTAALVSAQAAFIQAQVDHITNEANRQINLNGIKIAVANLTGDKGAIPDLIQNQIAVYVGEKGPLQAALAQAQATGNLPLQEAIYDQLAQLDQSIAQAVEDKFQAASDAVDQIAQRQNTATDIRSRLAALGGSSFNSLNAQTGVLRQHGTDLQSQIAQQYQLLSQATTTADIQKVTQQIAELNTQLAENSDALRQNAEDIKAATVQQITDLGSFRGGIASGTQGLINSLGALNGTTDTTSLLKSLNNQQTNLKGTGSALRQQLLSQYGINLSNDPTQLVQQLNNTDFGALEFGMDDTTKSTFETLINAIIENAGALVDNTTTIQQTTGQQIQDWSSSLWQNFRDALFTGNGTILNSAIPQAATGAHVLSAGLMKVHGGETVVPASVSKYEHSATNIAVNVHGNSEAVDPIAISKRIAYEMKTR